MNVIGEWGAMNVASSHPCNLHDGDKKNNRDGGGVCLDEKDKWMG